MSDIIITASYFKMSVDKKRIPLMRVQRHVRNKYSTRFNEVEKDMNEKRALEFQKRELELKQQSERASDEKEIGKLQEAK